MIKVYNSVFWCRLKKNAINCMSDRYTVTNHDLKSICQPIYGIIQYLHNLHRLQPILQSPIIGIVKITSIILCYTYGQMQTLIAINYSDRVTLECSVNMLMNKHLERLKCLNEVFFYLIIITNYTVQYVVRISQTIKKQENWKKMEYIVRLISKLLTATSIKLLLFIYRFNVYLFTSMKI